MENDRKINVLCFGGEDWWYHNRAHTDMQLMRRFAKIGTTLYVNSIVMQKPSLKKGIGGGKSFSQKLLRKIKSILQGLKKSDAGFWVCSPFSLPVHHIGGLRMLNELVLRLQLRLIAWKLGVRNPVIWVACPAACDVALAIRKNKLVYQRTDRFEDSPNVDAKTIEKYDRRLKADADLTVYVNKTLYNEETAQCKRAVYLDHGVDYEMFASAEKKQDIPADITTIRKPIVGFFGGIADHKFDIELMEKVVESLPEFSFVLVGDVSQDCRSMLDAKNVWMLGRKPYDQIPHYGKCFDVAIMPSRHSRWMEAANPIKLKEYLALGKPVVSTHFSELQDYLDVVYAADTPKSFTECIQKALNEDCPERVAARREKVQNATWDSKADTVLDELLREKTIKPRGSV